MTTPELGCEKESKNIESIITAAEETNNEIFDKYGNKDLEKILTPLYGFYYHDWNHVMNVVRFSTLMAHAEWDMNQSFQQECQSYGLDKKGVAMLAGTAGFFHDYGLYRPDYDKDGNLINMEPQSQGHEVVSAYRYIWDELISMDLSINVIDDVFQKLNLEYDENQNQKNKRSISDQLTEILNKHYSECETEKITEMGLVIEAILGTQMIPDWVDADGKIVKSDVEDAKMILHQRAKLEGWLATNPIARILATADLANRFTIENEELRTYFGDSLRTNEEASKLVAQENNKGIEPTEEEIKKSIAMGEMIFATNPPFCPQIFGPNIDPLGLGLRCLEVIDPRTLENLETIFDIVRTVPGFLTDLTKQALIEWLK